MAATTPLAPGAVRVTEAGRGNYTQTISNGRQEWTADEPESLGGRDEGPNPYDLLAASLGACVAITVRMYADRKGWPMSGITVDVMHSKIHAEDCAECESETGMIDRLEKTVYLVGDDLDNEQLDRLMDIADRCPVHRTLISEVQIVTTRG